MVFLYTNGSPTQLRTTVKPALSGNSKEDPKIGFHFMVIKFIKSNELLEKLILVINSKRL